MARVEDKKKAIELRKQGLSYSDIKKTLHVSKSTLSGWLKEYPLSKKRMRELRDLNPRRIETFRRTMALKKQERLECVLQDMKKEIGTLSERDVFIAGLFLYWGEGTKTQPYRVEITNTDPNMLDFFLKWLKDQKVDRSRVKVKLHLYSDMDQRKEERYWRKRLNLPKRQFQKTQVKKSGSKSGAYKGLFKHGTCSLILDDRDVSERMQMGLQALREIYTEHS